MAGMADMADKMRLRRVRLQASQAFSGAIEISADGVNWERAGLLSYSAFKASSGLTLAARQAGTQAAPIATTIRIVPTRK